MAKQTYSKGERRAQFLETGIALAKKGGLDSVTAVAVAAKHEVSAPLVFHIFGSRDKLRAAIKREAKKQGVVLADPKAPRKRSIAEVKAATGKRKVSRSAKDGKFVGKATVAANPDTTVTQTVSAPRKKYPTQPVPAINMVGGEPKASI